MKRLVIIDGNSLLFRAYFAMREMVTKDGLYTQGVFAFINMLTRIIGDYSPDYIAVAFDMKAKTFRHKMYPEYKAGRQSTPIELLSQIPLMHEVLEAMNISVFELESYEADDIIGTITREASEQGIESYVITGDKDELQLVSDNTKVIINKRGMTDFDIYDEAAMKERYDITPTQFIDLKGLMGDKSDNIPGIPGVGEKKGIALLKQYGSVEEVVAHADEIKGKLGENVRNNIESALMSKKLATIERHVPVEFTFEELKMTSPDLDKLVKVYTKLEFNSFLKKLNTRVEEDILVNNIDAEIGEVRTVDMDYFVQNISDGENISITIDTDDNHKDTPFVSGIAVYSESRNEFAYRPLTLFDTEAVLSMISGLNIRVTGIGLKQLAYTMLHFADQLPEFAHDIEIAEYLIDPNRSKYHLSSMSLKYCEKVIDDKESIELEEKHKRNLYLISRIAYAQKNYLEDMALTDLFNNVEMPLIQVIASMEFEGITVNKAVLEDVGVDLDAKIKSLESAIHEEAGSSFNINSPKQLGVVLFEDMGLPYPKASKGKTGYSTAADVLDKLKLTAPIVNNVLEYRKAAKLKSTYIDGLIALIGTDGRIHPHFNQTVAATGRLSCTEPNLQNIPIRDDYGRNIRKAFITSGTETVFIGADYSQIELRIMAALSGDTVLIDAFNEGRDIHRLTASRVFNIDIDKVTPLDRSRAKAVNFGVIYGMSGFGLSEELGITRTNAQKYIDDYFEKHTQVKEYLDNQISIGKENKEVRTICGRIRQIPEFSSRKYMDLQLANRLAMNTPIQGSAADIIKIAMVKVYKALNDAGCKSRLILQIHDELIIEAYEDELDTVKKLLTDNMEHAVNLAVKLTCDVHTGNTWYELK